MGNQSDIETKCELALVRHLNGIAPLISGITIHAGVDPSTLSAPYIVCNSINCDEEIKFTGNYAVDLDIEIVSIAHDTTAAQHRDRIARIREEIANDWVGASLNAHVSDFTVAGGPVWGVVIENSETMSDAEHWMTKMSLLIHCRPSD